MLPLAQDEDWPEVHVARVNGDAEGEWHHGFGGRRACFPMAEGLLRLERERSVMTMRTEQPLDDDRLVHPWVTWGAAMFARWHGREGFHGGAFVSGGRAWAVLADKEGGKSTLLARLALGGTDIVSDDLLVIEDGHVFAGPRCVDLRAGTAERLDVGHLPLARRDRRRLPLTPVPGRLPLAGVVHLAWSDTLAVREVPLSDRIARLRPHNGFGMLPAGPSELLSLAALPTLELSRPKDLGRVSASAELLAATAH